MTVYVCMNENMLRIHMHLYRDTMNARWN